MGCKEMITTTGIYKELFNKGAIQEYYVDIDDMIFYNDNLYSITIRENMFEEDTFCVGSCCASELEFVIANTSFDIKPKSKVKFYYRYVSGNTHSEWIKKFEGNITSSQSTDNGRITVNAVNYLSNNENYSRVVKSIVTYPAPARYVARVIGERLGLPLYNEEDIIDVDLYVEPADDDLLVDILKDIAVLSSGNWTVSQDKLRMIVPNNNDASVGEYGVGDIDYLGELDKVNGIELYDMEDKTYTSGSVGYDDFIIQLGSKNASQQATDYIYSKLNDYEYVGYRSTRAYIDPAIELGDYYTMNGTDGERQLCVMMTWVFDGSCICNVESPYQPIERQLTSEQQNIENEINAALPFMVYDCNNKDILRGTNSEVYVGMIPVHMTRDKVDVDAGFRTNVVVDNDGVLTERFYRDGIEELFSPVTINLTKGSHLISDDHAYLNVSKGRHTFVASLQFNGGNMSINTRKTLYTIEASRVGYRDIAIDGEMLDMAFSGSTILSREELYPSEVWILAKNLDTNVADIKHFLYNYENENDVDIIDDIDYAVDFNAKAIAFSGYWEESKYFQGKKIFVSEGVLKVGAITNNGRLCIYNYNNPITPLYEIEASGVVEVSMIQGWNFKDSIQASNNMGLIVSYIMNDGKLYYKTITDTIDVNRYEITFPNSIYPLTNIETFRTNDYRVGFTVTGLNNQLYTAITDRYYQGDSVEKVHLESSFNGGNIDFGFSDYIVPKVIDGSNEDDVNIVIDFNYDALGTMKEDSEEKHVHNDIYEDDNITGIHLRDSKEVPQEYYPVDNTIEHKLTSSKLLFKAQNSNTGGLFSIVQDWGIYEPAKGISDAIAPIYAVINNSNLLFEREYGGAPSIIFGIENQEVLLEHIAPTGNPFPTPYKQTKTDSVTSLLSPNNVYVSFEEIISSNAYDNENQKLSCVINNDIISIDFMELIKTDIFDKDARLSTTLSNDAIKVIEWKVLSDEPI